MANSDGEVEKFEGKKSRCENQKEAAICLHEPSKNMAAMCLHEQSKNNSDVLARGLAGTNTKKPPEPMMTQAVIIMRY